MFIIQWNFNFVEKLKNVFKLLFISVLFIQQESKLCTLSIIIKSAVSGDYAFELMTANGAYDKEIEFYSKIVPKINQAFDKLNETTQLIPKVYGVCALNCAILLEDLKPQNYRIGSAHRGFNFDQAKMVLRKAAILHSINAVLQEEDPDIFQNFNYGIILNRLSNKSWDEYELLFCLNWKMI